MDCELCGLREREAHRVVYADDAVVVVVNIEPLKEGHLMILPVRHAENLGDLDPAEAKAFLGTVDRCAKVVGNLSEDPPICLVNYGTHRSQPHLHVHVLPSKQPLRGLFAASEGLDRRVRASQETLTKMADELRGQLKK